MRKVLPLILVVSVVACGAPRARLSDAPFQGRGVVTRVIDGSHVEVRVEETWDGTRSQPLEAPFVRSMDISSQTTYVAQSLPASAFTLNFYTMGYHAAQRVAFGGVPEGDVVHLLFLGPTY